MGALLVAAVRLVLFALTALVSVASGFILARKLPAEGYAVYQVALRRGGLAVAAVASTLGLWMYRSLSRGSGPEARAGALLLAAVSAVLGAAGGAAVSPLLGLGPASSVLLAAALAGMGAWTVARLALEASRPLRAGVAALLQRLLNAVMVVALVYLLRLGLQGAFASAAAAWWLASAAAFRWAAVSPRLLLGRLRAALLALRGWLSRAPAAAPHALAALAASFDAAVVYALAGPLAVAGYAAVTSVLRLSVEVANNAMLYLHRLLLRGGRLDEATRAAGLTLLAAAPLLGYAAAHPEHLAALVNPRYLWAAPVVPLAAAAVVLNTVGVSVQQMHRGLVEPGEGEERRLAAALALRLAAELAYLALAAAAAALAPGPLAAGLGWAAAYAARGLLYSLLPAAVEPRLRRPAAALLARATLYTAAAYLAAHASPPPGPPAPRFLEEATLLARGFAPAAILYTALTLAADPQARRLAATAARRLPALPRGWRGAG